MTQIIMKQLRTSHYVIVHNKIFKQGQFESNIIVLRSVECDYDDLRIKKFDNGYDGSIDWAMFIGFNRDKRYYEGHRKLYEKYDSYNENYNLIIGPIANDKMFQLLERFYTGDLCDRALISGLTQIKLGDQYVFKTKKSCDKDHIKIFSER